MKSKYAWITDYARELASEIIPGEITYRRCARMGGHHDNLSVIVCYKANDNGRWKSQGEVVSLIPSYIDTPDLSRGSIHNKRVADIPR